MIIKIWKKFVLSQFNYWFSSDSDDLFKQLRKDMAEGYLSKKEKKLINKIEAKYKSMENGN